MINIGVKGDECRNDLSDSEFPFVGYLDCDCGEFTHPTTSEKMPVASALSKGYIRGTQAEIDQAIEAYHARRKGSVMEYKLEKVSSLTNQSKGHYTLQDENIHGIIISYLVQVGQIHAIKY